MGMAGKFFHMLHTEKCVYKRGTRTFDHYMYLVEIAGAVSTAYKHEVYLSPGEQEFARSWLKNEGVNSRFVIFSVSAGNTLKEWPIDRFVALAIRLNDSMNIPILFSSADTNKTARATTEAQQKGVDAVDAGRLNLRQLSAVIACADALVSVDTGPLYIAHALSVPVVDIIGPVDPNEQPPRPAANVGLVLPPLPIQPTSFVAETLRTETSQQRMALDLTTVDMVYEEVMRVLNNIHT